jgi:tRNA-dihydrouridine synthase B
VTNHAFRLMCKRAGGCGLVTTEMFSAYAVKYRNPRTKTMIDWTDEERPVSVQIFGGDPETVAIAAKRLADSGADIIDLNFGCAVPKVVKTGSGAALLKDLDRAYQILTAARRAVTIPLTVKTRAGWAFGEKQGLDLARIAEACGADAITVHGRVAEQGYSQEADWDIIAQVKAAVRMPVIANGDIFGPTDAARVFAQSGCDGAMIGRGALGDPWVFARTAEYLRTGRIVPAPTFADKLAAAKRHGRLLTEILGQDRAAREMRGHVIYYIKGMPGAPKLRGRLMKTKSIDEIEAILDEASDQHQPGRIEAR